MGKRLYDLMNSQEVFKLFKALYFHPEGWSYSDLLEITGKKKSVLSDQLKPLKDEGLIIKKYDRKLKEYWFAVDYGAYYDLVHPNLKKTPKIRERLLKEEKKFVKTNNLLFLCVTFNQYLLMLDKKVVIGYSKEYLKGIFI